ncbi:hypothetical protein PS1_036411 [Malus domestica]
MFGDQSSSSPYVTPSLTAVLGPPSTFQQQTLLFNFQQPCSPGALESEGPFYMPSFEEPTPFPSGSRKSQFEVTEITTNMKSSLTIVVLSMSFKCKN